MIAIRTFDGAGLILLHDREIFLEPNSILIVARKNIVNYRTLYNRWYFYWFEFNLDNPPESVYHNFLLINNNEELTIRDIYTSLSMGNNTLASCGFSYLYSKWLTGRYEPSSIIKEIASYIDLQPLDTNITIEQLCDKYNISERSLRNKFYKLFGISPKEYILEKKFSAVKVLLQSTDMKINEIAFKAGFTSEYYFSKAFKKRFGIAPSQFREHL